MGWSNYEKALALLEQNKVDYDFVSGCSDHLIEKAETALSLKFSKIYKHFINNYGAGVFATYEILGVTHENFHESPTLDYPDAVRFTLTKRRLKRLPENFITIIDYDPDIVYCLDFSKLNDENEPAVVSFNLGEDWGEQKLIAEDFGDFLLEIIQDEIEALKLSPIKIIYDVVALKGTCYVEIKPGKDTGDHWNKDSIYFTDETFTYLSISIEKMYKRYSLWGFSEIDKYTWGLILDDLEELKLFLKENPKENEVKNKIGFLFDDKTESQFKENFNQNVLELINLIIDFQKWISEQCKSHDYITILGI
ncbi:SMI1/KNR4 family protein [Bacillus sp. AFS029533]|uniref:SMI1/KNR4 family protein n=1 Tax=Bacillus sp. AFS029533 TaxID=2033494 RepID=UPI000BFB1D0B|nr:SMI1/KNR4 family protein [Bacillus sp. AFS029533]PGZ90922.1 hypothetical protein COE53_16420 [Bacillus sp. AFS029533]